MNAFLWTFLYWHTYTGVCLWKPVYHIQPSAVNTRYTHTHTLTCMVLISCAERVFLVFFGFFVCLCQNRTETTVLHNSFLTLDCWHQKQCSYLNVHLLGAQSEPVLHSVLGEADAIKEHEAGRAGLSGARAERANAQAPTHRVVAHLHQLIGVWRFQRERRSHPNGTRSSHLVHHLLQQLRMVTACGWRRCLWRNIHTAPLLPEWLTELTCTKQGKNMSSLKICVGCTTAKYNNWNKVKQLNRIESDVNDRLAYRQWLRCEHLPWDHPVSTLAPLSCASTTLCTSPLSHLHFLLMQQLYTGLFFLNERKIKSEKTKWRKPNYELNSEHQTPEQQPSNIPTVRSFSPASRATFSLIIPKSGECKCRSNIYQGEKSHICLVMLNIGAISGMRNLVWKLKTLAKLTKLFLKKKEIWN